MAINAPMLSDPMFQLWWDYRSTPEERERFRLEEEKFWAAVDMSVYAETFGDLHPNEGYEYEPLVRRRILSRK